MFDELNATIRFLNQLADKLDGWATESRSGGWSTHQVAANRDAADDCRRRAAELRVVLNKETQRMANKHA